MTVDDFKPDDVVLLVENNNVHADEGSLGIVVGHWSSNFVDVNFGPREEPHKELTQVCFPHQLYKVGAL